MLAHGNVLADKFYDAGRVREIALDHHAAGLDEVDVPVMDLADKVASNASSVTQADVDGPPAVRARDDRGRRVRSSGKPELAETVGARRSGTRWRRSRPRRGQPCTPPRLRP
jgi:hypothetical protein